MANLHIHLAVAKRYLEKQGGIENIKDFYDGNIIPDLAEDKEATHYGVRSEKQNILKRNFEKVNPEKFLEVNALDNDLNRGRFLHLVTDWEYYNNLLPKDRLQKMSFIEYGKSQVITRVLFTEQLIKKYDVSPSMVSFEKKLKEQMAKTKKEDSERFRSEKLDGEPFYTAQELDEFIERVSSIDLMRRV